jgi:hypothetical protein
MALSFWSTITLFTELMVTASIYFIVWKAYRTGKFLRIFAFVILGYELFFNVSYMLSREVAGETSVVYKPYETGLAIFHGIFSLVMFIALVTFFIVAARAYKRGKNYFLLQPKLTFLFVIAWGVSILSGITLFTSLYFF